MNLSKKKSLAARTLGVGKERIFFVKTELDEIEKAITKQDIRDLIKSGAIMIKEKKGRMLKPKKHKKRTFGNIRINVNQRKRRYIVLTRKLRKYVGELREQGKLKEGMHKDLRKRIKNKEFKSKANLKTHVEEILK